MSGVDIFIRKFEEALLSVDRQSAREVLMAAVEKYGENQAVDQLIVRVLDHIGEKWESGDAALSQVYMSGVICEELISEFTEAPSDIDAQDQPKIAIVTFMDYHSLGKRIVLSVLAANGLKALDYGQGIDTETLLKKVHADGIRILLISTLMLHSALRISDVRRGIDRLGLDVRIVAGGAPFRFDETLWKQVGADAMGRTSSDASIIVRHMLEEIK